MTAIASVMIEEGGGRSSPLATLPNIMLPTPSMEECRYIALQLEKGGYDSIPEAKEPGLLEAAEFRLLVQQALSSYRPGPTRRWRLGIAGALQSNARHFSGLEGMAVSDLSLPRCAPQCIPRAVTEPA